MDRLIINVTRDCVTADFLNHNGEERINNPVSLAARKAFNAESVYCTAESMSLRFHGEVTYSQVFKLPGIVRQYLKPVEGYAAVRVPFTFALSESDRLW